MYNLDIIELDIFFTLFKNGSIHMKLVTSMSSTKAKDFFLKSESYFSFDLPKYFDFNSIIQLSNSLITGKDFMDSIVKSREASPEKKENVDYLIIHNKDGKYAWRPFELIHPILYVKLVNDICKPKNWSEIKKRLKQLQSNPNIICCSMPGESKNKKNDKKETILRWWNEYEQKSISASIEYSLMANTDISNCYLSIYTHSISWALHTKMLSKVTKGDLSYIGNLIDKDITQMRYGQTNGIPQGSILMDFIAEIILGYCDELLTEKLDSLNISDYKILRYRDDYRIFCNNSLELELILKSLSEVLIELNLKLNTTKTYTTKDVVIKSIKDDKIGRFINQNSFGKLTLQKQLFLIDKFGKDYPNSGSLVVLLNDIFKNKIEKMTRRPNSYEQVISIVIDIMYNNPRTYPICVAILSHIFKFLDKQKTVKYIDLIVKKFKSLPNTVYLEIWLQRITISVDRNKQYSNGSICEKIYNQSLNIWNSDWLKDNIKRQFNENLIINEREIENIPLYLSRAEVDAFSTEYDA